MAEADKMNHMIKIKKTAFVFISTLIYVTSGINAQEYNGLKVEGRFLYDQCGEKVILRGINAFIVFWDRDGSVHYPEIAKTGANCVRIFWRTGHDPEPFMSPDDLDETIQNCINNQMLPMVCLWDATGKSFESVEWNNCLNYWTDPRVMAVLKKHQKFLLLNIANEVGKNDVTNGQYRSAYEHAIDTLRKSGLHVPLVIDASNWGRAERYILDNAKHLINHDPDKNLIFSWHPWDNGTSETRVDAFFEQAKEDSIPIIVGEFSSTDVFGKQFADPFIWRHIMQRCYEYENGYLPWWWASSKDSAIHEITHDRTYGNWANDPWGEEVAVGSKYSIQKTSVRPAPVRGETCVSTKNIILPVPAVIIQPNPAKNTCTIRLPFQDAVNITVFNATGLQMERFKKDNDFTIDLKAYAKGIYFLAFENENWNTQYKLIKE